MATVRDFINQALTKMGVIAQGQLPNASEAAFCFTELNTQIDEWNVEGLSLFTQTRNLLAMQIGKTSYQIGPGAIDFPAYPRPARIVSAGWIVGGVRKPLDLIVAAQFTQIPEPNNQSIHAKMLYCDYAYPFANIYPWPTAQNIGTVLELFLWQPLSQFATLDDVVDFPVGYRSALQNTLIVRVGPSFGWQTDPTIIASAGDAKGAISRFNAETLGIPLGPPAPAAPPAAPPQ